MRQGGMRHMEAWRHGGMEVPYRRPVGALCAGRRATRPLPLVRADESLRADER
jgi:hypothetical protein